MCLFTTTMLAGSPQTFLERLMGGGTTPYLQRQVVPNSRPLADSTSITSIGNFFTEPLLMANSLLTKATQTQ